MFNYLPVVDLAAAGTTGNNTHSSVQIPKHHTLHVQFVISAVGATPTVTYKIQFSYDDTVWVDAVYSDYATPGTLTTSAKTSTGVASYFLCLYQPARYMRLVTTSNTNVTYGAKAWFQK